MNFSKILPISNIIEIHSATVQFLHV